MICVYDSLPQNLVEQWLASDCIRKISHNFLHTGARLIKMEKGIESRKSGTKSTIYYCRHKE